MAHMVMRFKTHGQLTRFLIGFFLQALPGAMLVPMTTLDLAARGVDATLIGALATTGALAYIVSLPAAPVLIARLGAGATLRLALAVRAATVAGLVIWDTPALVVVLYAALGFAAGLVYTIAETWVPSLARDGQSGRALAIYQTIVGASSFVGAGLVLLTGVAGATPRVVAVVAMLLGSITLWQVRTPAQPAGEGPGEARTGLVSRSPRAALRGLLAQAGPAVLAAALVGGIFEAGLAVALPLYGLAVDAGPAMAAGLATALGLGSLLQYPFGAMTDRWPWRHVAVGTAATIAASALLLPLAPNWPWLLLPLGVVWGSAGGGLYTLATIRNAARYRGEALVGASVVSQLAYMLGEAAGPAAGGLAIDLAPRHGLPVLVGGVALLGLVGMLATARAPQASGATAEGAGEPRGAAALP